MLIKAPISALLAASVLCLSGTLHAAMFYVAPAGNDNAAGTLAAPFRTIRKGAMTARAGDTVFIRNGTYAESVNPPNSGTANAWITFSAFAGEMPIIEGNGGGGTGFGSTTAQYIRVVGLVVRNFASSAFANGWVNDVGTSNGNWQFVNCIAEGNGINGIAFYNASGLLIDQCIVAHNGNQLPSWSSGVNLFHLSGTFQTNIVRRTVSFENIDISANHSDGSGFILDQNSSGATFENNIGFRNGGSCIRLTNSPNAHLVNNTCYHNGLEPSDINPPNPGEIFFSDPTTRMNVVFVNNLGAASGWNNTQNAFNAVLGSNSLAVDKNGATPFFKDPANLDLTLSAGSTALVDKGTATNAPSTDIGFDPKCIRRQSGQAVAFWQNAPDYAYIQSVGGVAGCFKPTPRPQGAAPDIGAYEFSGTLAPGTGGASGVGGGGASSGAASGASANGGRANGGASGAAAGNTSSSGSAGIGGNVSASGGSSAAGAPTAGASARGNPDNAGQASGCGCSIIGGASRSNTPYLIIAGCLLFGIRRGRRGQRRLDPG